MRHKTIVSVLTALVAATGLVAAASPASASTITSTGTLSETSGSAAAGYAYPNANISFTGDISPGNATYPRSVRLMIWVPSTGTWTVAAGYQNTTGAGKFSFTDHIPKGEPYARWNVQATQRTANGNTWTSVITNTVVVTQTNGIETLSMSTASPTIMETGNRSTPEGIGNAAQLANVYYTTGGATRTINLQTVDPYRYGDYNWHELAESITVPAFTTSVWTPRTDFWSSAQYRAVFHYTTGLDNTSAVFTPAAFNSVFADDFNGTGQPTANWDMYGGDGSTSGLAKHDWRAGYLNGDGTYVQNIVPDPDVNDCGGSAPTCHVLDQDLVAKNFFVPVPPVGGVTWIAARVKFDNNNTGSTSAFWTYDNTPADDGHYNEHDIVEYYGPNAWTPKAVATTWAHWSKDPNQLYDQARTAGTFNDSYHIWATAYRRDANGVLTLQEYLDGQPTGVTFPTTASTPGRACPAWGCTPSVPSDADQTLFISNHVSGGDQAAGMTQNLFGGSLHSAHWDWVQVWTG